MAGTDEILLERRGALGVVTLNRPQALNTLSLGMYRMADPQLRAWERDPAIRAILIQAVGGKAFCAGGDVRAVYEARREKGGPGDYKADFFREEYWLIERIHRSAKPHIALVDGITMGGGMGISVNGSHQVATERTQMAMPEVHIGLFPDVGATRFLNRCPGRSGLYLALTGSRIKAADAVYCGLANRYVPHDDLPALVEALMAIAWRAGEERGQVDATLRRFERDPGPAPLAQHQSAIDRCFAGDSVEGIISALDREGTDWAKDTVAAIERASPLSVKITFQQLRQGKQGIDLADALKLEYRLTQHVMAGHDFYEGIRALLVDKDHKPRWQHRRLADVTEAEVAGYFESLGDRELKFSEI
jgi:enoyl-CoA hydratase